VTWRRRGGSYLATPAAGLRLHGDDRAAAEAAVGSRLLIALYG